MTTDPQAITLSSLNLDALRKGQGHKYDHGHALVLTGGPGRTGAARLAARAALRIGAGAVTLGVPPAAQMEVAMQVTAVMLMRMADADALRDTLTDRRLNALCLGPGLGTDDRQVALLRVALAHGGACVLDADALTLLGQDGGLVDMLHADCVLTPHAGEFARVFPAIAKRMDEGLSRVDACREAAQSVGCTVLLKGPETVIADAAGACAIHHATGARAAPWLATAGAGDTLAGFITGLLARGLSPIEAAKTGAFLHVECALKFGPGLIAEDLADALPDVLKTLL